MEMEMLMIAGFVYNFFKENDKAKFYYSRGLEQATALKNENYKNICLCNLGVISGESDFDDFFNKLEEDHITYESLEQSNR